jgi:putative phosphoribosyl transferase
MRFEDRYDAGRQLAGALSGFAGRQDVIVLGLPRGGVPVAFEVARALRAPMDVFVVRKLGVPGHSELAMGAIASGGVRVLSEDLIGELGISRTSIDEISAREQIELERRDRLYRGDRSLPSLRDRTVILVDDGLATGATMEAAVAAVRLHRPARVVVAVPVGARETCQRLRTVADETICAQCPEPFQAVGLWYLHFDQTTDDEVIELLRQQASEAAGSRSAPASTPSSTRS